MSQAANPPKPTAPAIPVGEEISTDALWQACRAMRASTNLLLQAAYQTTRATSVITDNLALNNLRILLNALKEEAEAFAEGLHAAYIQRGER